MRHRITTIVAALSVGMLFGAVAGAFGVPIPGALIAGLFYAFVSGLLASKESDRWPQTLEGCWKSVGCAAAFVGVNLVFDCALGAVFPANVSFLEECRRHWPFWVTALAFVPILGATIVQLIRVAVGSRFVNEG